MRTHRFDRRSARPAAIREVCLAGGPDQKYQYFSVGEPIPNRPARPDRATAPAVSVSLCAQR